MSAVSIGTREKAGQLELFVRRFARFREEFGVKVKECETEEW